MMISVDGLLFRKKGSELGTYIFYEKYQKLV